MNRRVLHIAPTPFFADRGCHIRIRGIVGGLAARGYDNLVCTYPIGRDIDGVATLRCASIPGYTRTEAGPSGFKYIADVLLLWTVVRAIRRYRPDVLHCHLHEGVLIGWLAKWLSLNWRLPVVFDMQGGLTGELEAHGFFGDRRWLLRLFRWIERRIVVLSDVNVCSSEASVDLLVGTFRLDPSLVFLARDGADIHEQRTSMVAVDAVDADTHLVVYSGGLASAKGLEVLQEVIRESGARHLPVKFLIVGYPTEDLAAYLSAHGLASSCQLTGQVPFDDLAGYLALASVALEPKMGGSGEASGKLVNYMAAGLPVVCFDTPNNRDILEGEGFFAADGDVGAFVHQLETAIYNPDRAYRIGAAGRQRVERRFSWAAAAEQINAAYVEVGRGQPGSFKGTENEEVL